MRNSHAGFGKAGLIPKCVPGWREERASLDFLPESDVWEGERTGSGRHRHFALDIGMMIGYHVGTWIGRAGCPPVLTCGSRSKKILYDAVFPPQFPPKDCLRQRVHPHTKTVPFPKLGNTLKTKDPRSEFPYAKAENILKRKPLKNSMENGIAWGQGVQSQRAKR